MGSLHLQACTFTAVLIFHHASRSSCAHLHMHILCTSPSAYRRVFLALLYTSLFLHGEAFIYLNECIQRHACMSACFHHCVCCAPNAYASLHIGIIVYILSCQTMHISLCTSTNAHTNPPVGQHTFLYILLPHIHTYLHALTHRHTGILS